ncbi:hypothetical protein [Kribbella soli]|uniref:ATP-binding cassette domain-containing protein n=1 Tax=Kribbella soli TaxID=1124743 RepID=A0A4R0HFM6_9ACTN|nr:hypothetical protein [Kribbella soli]TCC09997.1 hypothetical protein E0H45_01260 [Kribbella soli]
MLAVVVLARAFPPHFALLIKGMNRRDAWDRAELALARVELTDRAGTRTSELSGGQLRRVGVAATLATTRASCCSTSPPTTSPTSPRRPSTSPS